jgi:hypothetical protein
VAPKLDHSNVAMLRRNGIDFVHIRALAVETHGHDGTRAWRNRGLQLPCIEIAGIRFDVDKHRFGTHQRDDFGRRDKRKWRSNDFIAGPDLECHQRDQQSFSTTGNADAMGGSDVGGQFCFQQGDLRPEYVLPMIQNLLDTGIDGLTQCAVLCFKINIIHRPLV